MPPCVCALPPTIRDRPPAPDTPTPLSVSVSCVSDCTPPRTRTVGLLGSSSHRLQPPPPARLVPHVSSDAALAAMVDRMDDGDLDAMLTEG